MTEERLTVTSPVSQPLNYLVTLKVGSTYLRNLIYVLDHGEPFSKIERDFPRELPSKHLTKAELINETSFFVVRDPVARFFSLYFDKAIGAAGSRFPWMVEILVTNRVFHVMPDLTIEQHRENCMSLLGFLGVRLRGQIKGAINPHWNKQFLRAEQGLNFGMKPLMLDRLDQQLLHIADGRIDGLEAAMAKVKNRNRSPRPVEAEDIMTPEIYAKISALYPEDIQLYDLVKTGWDMLGHPPEIEI